MDHHRENAWLRHQQSRWLRPDAHRWVRPDAQRFVAPGKGLAAAFPALARKYSPDQPRVPAGSPDGGQWTDGTNGPVASTGEGGFGDLVERNDFPELFQIAPYESDFDGVQLAGDPPVGDSPQEPPDEPPEIPAGRPAASGEAMRFVRKAVAWIRLAGRYSPGASSFLAALEEAQHLKGLTDAIKAATDPPRSLEELQERATLPNEDGYHNHHIAEKKAARDAGDPESLIEARNNLARIPALQHIEITRYYATKVERKDGSRTSPRESLKDADFETRWQYGIDVLRRYGVLK